MSISVDIVIPTLLTQPEMLEACLRSVAQVDARGLKVHLYIVCNTVKTAPGSALVRKYQSKQFPFALDWLFLGSNTGFAYAMNQGFKAGKGELVFCLNDDTTLKSSCLQELVRTQRETGADMVASTIFLSDTKKIDSQGFTFWWRGKAKALEIKDSQKFAQANDHWLNNTDFFPTAQKTTFMEPFGPDAAACIYSRKLLDKTDAFQTSFFAYLEDVDLALRARKLDMYCVLAKDAVVYHHKHATSGKWKNFKTKRDFLNWWRICLHTYPKKAWGRFWPSITLERARNFSGLVKSYLP